MKGYVARKGDRWYAVIYEGIDPSPAGNGAAGTPPAPTAPTPNGSPPGSPPNARPRRRGPLAHLRRLPHRAWLPGKRLVLAASTYAGYRPQRRAPHPPQRSAASGCAGCARTISRRSTTGCCTPPTEPALAPKTVYEIHLVIRGALADAVRRGLLTRNVALVAHAPGCARSPRSSSRPGPPSELQRSYGPPPATASSPPCGSRRSPACAATSCSACAGTTSTPAKATISINRGLVAVGYELHETRGKTPNARRRIDLDPTTIGVLTAWRALAAAEAARRRHRTIAAGVHRRDGQPVHPHAISQAFERIARRASVRVIRLHDLRHTHGTLLIAAGVPVKVVSERLGHATPAFTIETYQHVLPGMQADAARVFERLVTPAFYRPPNPEKPGRSAGRTPPEPVERPGRRRPRS